MRGRNAIAACTLLLAFAVPQGRTAWFRRGRTAAGPGVSLRQRLHVNDLIAEPGTVELDFGGLYSYTTGSLTLPSAVKFTPGGGSLLQGRTEYSVAFDSVASAINADARATQFSDRLTFAATSVVFDSPHFDIAVAPQVTTFLRNESGMRLGAAVIARYDGVKNDMGLFASWTAATSATDTNPAGAWDIGAGYGRRLAATGFLGRLTPHCSWIFEKTTGFGRTFSVFGGIEYHISERVAFDVSGQRFSLAGSGPDRQLLVGLTVNLGKPWQTETTGGSRKPGGR